MNQEPDLRRIVMAAVDLAAAGRNDEALRVLETAGRDGLVHPIVRNVVGDIYLKLGRKREALKAFDVAVRNAPGYPEAHCNRGVALQQLGRLEEAVAAFDRALRLRPQYAIAHFNRGNALRDLRRLDDAIAAYGRALAIEPRFAEAWLNRGETLRRKGEAIRALDDLDRALRLRPSYVEAQAARIETLFDLDRPEEALTGADLILGKQPADPRVMAVKVCALIALNALDEALAVADELARLHPADAGSHAIRSAALREKNRAEEALLEAREAVRLAPTNPQAHLALALSLDPTEAAGAERTKALDRAEQLGASFRELAIDRAGTLTAADRIDEAMAIYRRLLTQYPGDRTIAYNNALLLLTKGDYLRGFADYELRIDLNRSLHGGRDKLGPRWKGEAMPGRRLLLYKEQGLGDIIQFARFLPKVRESGAEVTLILQPPARRVLAEITRGMTVVDGVGAGHFDAQASMMSLAHIFGTTADTVPPAPYIRAEPALVEKWRARVGGEGFRIGVLWQGSIRYKGDRFRSIRLDKLAPVAALPGVRLISLQAINGLDQLSALPPGMMVETLGPEASHPQDGLAEVAAVIENLDLVLSVDSGVAHLAGALGRPVWTLLRAQPEWRWLEGRSDTPWYGSMRLFRQKTLGDWDPVVATIVAALEEARGA